MVAGWKVYPSRCTGPAVGNRSAFLLRLLPAAGSRLCAIASAVRMTVQADEPERQAALEAGPRDCPFDGDGSE